MVGKESAGSAAAAIGDDLVRAYVVPSVARLIGRYDNDPSHVLRQFGYDPNIDMNSDDYMCCSLFMEMVEHCSLRYGSSTFGIDLAMEDTSFAREPAFILMKYMENLESSLGHLRKYWSLFAPSYYSEIRGVDREFTELQFISSLPGWSYKRQSNEYAIGYLVKVFRSAVAADLKIGYVRVAAKQPAETSALEYRLGCRVLYDQPFNAIAFPCAELSRKIPTHDPVLAHILIQHLTCLLHDLSTPLERRIDQLVTAGLPTGKVNLGDIARQIGKQSRSVQMELAKAGTEYSTILARRRELLAKDYLRDTRLAISEIATLLGYSEQAAFSRAFKDWVGMSPRTFREAG